MTIVFSNTLNITPESVIQQNEENIKLATQSNCDISPNKMSHAEHSCCQKRQPLPQPSVVGFPDERRSRPPRGLPKRPAPNPHKPHPDLRGIVAGGCVVSRPPRNPLSWIRRGGCWGIWRPPQLPPRLEPTICMPRIPRFPRFPRMPRIPRLPRLPRFPRFPRFPRIAVPRRVCIRPAMYERIMRPMLHRIDPRYDGRIR